MQSIDDILESANGHPLTIPEVIEVGQQDKGLALTLATEDQVRHLIDTGEWDEDDFTRWDETQEEMRVLMADARKRFGRPAYSN